jgi:hypothetical protein
MKTILVGMILILLSGCMVGFYDPGYYWQEPDGYYYYYHHEGDGHYYRQPDRYEKHGERYERWHGER